MKVGSGCSPLKPMKRPGWWKGKFALLWMLTTGEAWGLLSCLKANSPCLHNQWARAFVDRRLGLHVETAWSALTLILKLIICDLTSSILIVLGTVNLQFQGPFVPISLRPIFFFFFYCYMHFIYLFF